MNDIKKQEQQEIFFKDLDSGTWENKYGEESPWKSAALSPVKGSRSKPQQKFLKSEGNKSGIL